MPRTEKWPGLKIGPDTGYNSIGDGPVASGLAKFLDTLYSEGKLTKTILYNLKPSHNEVYATMIACTPKKR